MTYRLQAQHQKGNDRDAAGLIEKAIRIVQRLRDLNSLRDSEKDLLAELEKERTAYSE